MASLEPGLIKEGIKAVADTAKNFLEKLVLPYVEELGGLPADQVRFYRFDKQVRILLKV